MTDFQILTGSPLTMPDERMCGVNFPSTFRNAMHARFFLVSAESAIKSHIMPVSKLRTRIPIPHCHCLITPTFSGYGPNSLIYAYSSGGLMNTAFTVWTAIDE